jgi:plastocyanin
MQLRLARDLPGLALALALFAAVVAGCSSSDNGAAPTPPVTGPTFSFAFPAAGSVATPGTSNKRVFPAGEEGTWTYRCIPHGSAGMTGTVTVLAGAPVDSALVQVGAGNALAFGPNAVTIHAGGYVRWINVSSMTIHTVTRP